MSVIAVHDLVKTYPGPVDAVRGLSFSVEAGEVFGVLGPNGAGKSTTIRILATLSTPTSGSARVAGFDVATHPQEVRRRIGYVAQASAVDPQATARENLALQGRLFGLHGSALRGRVDELLSLFGLSNAAGRLVKGYSGGMRRRLDLAMGLVQRPNILWQEVERLAREEGLTILLTTHYLEEADRLASRVAIVDEGRLVALGTPDELKRTLRGDRVSVELADAEEVATGVEALRAVEGIFEVVIEGHTLHAQVEQGGRAVPGILQTLDRAGVSVSQVALSRPSLDDVYLTLTGKSFERAERALSPRGRKAEVAA
jgi:ABC-2 type transport system ATP-binding protein